MVFRKTAEINIDTPEVRDFVQRNTEVFRLAMNGMVEAAQNPEAKSEEENIALLLRATVAFAHGVCRTFNISPEDFANLMHFFDEVKIMAPKHTRVRFSKDRLS